ncbi:MAG: hypothetical protein NC548_06095 [Lachnospiraceae bacterium]|nr:hypothetical protein [Lachnospiraceae bacterium]
MENRAFIVHKMDGSQVRVIIVPFKGTSEYAFVNLTKGHICCCRFPSIDAAIADMRKRVIEDGIYDFEPIDEKSILF